MAYVTIHKDITNVAKTTPIGLTYVQTICLAVGGILGFGLYFLTSEKLGSGLASLLMMVSAAPFVFLGMYKDRTGKNFFELLPYIYGLYFKTNGERPYVSENIYSAMERQAELDSSIKKIIKKDKEKQKRQGKQKKGTLKPPKKGKTESEEGYVASKEAQKELNELTGRYKKSSKNKSAQDTIPYRAAYKSGIIQLSEEQWSKTIEFFDTSYSIASVNDKNKIFDTWCNLLNAFDSSIHVQMSYINLNMDKSKYMENIDMDPAADGFDDIREEYSMYLKSQLEKSNNGILKMRYMTICVVAEDYDKAKNQLNKLCSLTINNFIKIGVMAKELNGVERLNLLWNVNHPDVNQMKWKFDWSHLAKTGNTTKDIIAPSSYDFKDSLRLDAKNYFKIGRHLGSCSTVEILTGDYPDTVLQELLNIDGNMIVTMHIESIDQQKSIKFVKRQLSDINARKIDEQKKAARGGYDLDILPPELKILSEDFEEVFRQVSKEGARLFKVTFIICQFARTKKEIDNTYTDIKSLLQQFNCNANKLSFRQEQAFVSSLPLGINQIDIQRGLLTSELAIFLPFNTRELFQTGEINGIPVKPIYYGLNVLSNKMIMADRTSLKNPNGIILGVPGSGKTFAGKREMLNAFFISTDDILILDPEAEYKSLVKHLNGQVIELSLNSPYHINPMDIILDLDNSEDAEYDPISEKCSFISSLLETMLGGKRGLSPKEISIIDTCTRRVYVTYLNDPIPENIPRLQDLYEELKNNEYDEGRELAVAMEMYVTGSYSLFNNYTNVNIDNRIVCYVIKGLSGRLKDMGMLIIQNAIWDRVTINRGLKKKTRLYIDEFHLLLKNPQTASYSVEMWKRFRKWGGVPTGLTQNVTDFLKSKDVEGIFGNSEFVLLLSQNPNDADILAEYFQISSEQINYCKDVPSGHGLIIFGNNCILPFKDDFPRNTKMYSLLTSKLEEVVEEDDN